MVSKCVTFGIVYVALSWLLAVNYSGKNISHLVDVNAGLCLLLRILSIVKYHSMYEVKSFS